MAVPSDGNPPPVWMSGVSREFAGRVVVDEVSLLSLMRERLSGAMDVFRVAPVRPVEIPIGKVLASVSFNGFVLPVTHGIRLPQDIMLRGATHSVWQAWALGLIGLILFLLTWRSLRRSMTRV